MKKITLPATLLLASLSGFSATIDISTGVASWQSSGPNVVGTVPAAALGTNPNSVWIPAPGGSQWVSTLATDGSLATTTGLAGTYLFTLTFATGGFGGSLNYQVAADNQGTVRVLLDGLQIHSFSHPGNALTDASSAAQGCAFLPAGSNLCNPAGQSQGMVGPGAILFAAGGAGIVTIEATVVNSTPPEPSPVGFVLSGQASTNPGPGPAPDPVVPEPSTYALTAAGLTLLAWRHRRSSR